MANCNQNHLGVTRPVQRTSEALAFAQDFTQDSDRFFALFAQRDILAPLYFPHSDFFGLNHPLASQAMQHCLREIGRRMSVCLQSPIFPEPLQYLHDPHEVPLRCVGSVPRSTARARISSNVERGMTPPCLFNAGRQSGLCRLRRRYLRLRIYSPLRNASHCPD